MIVLNSDDGHDGSKDDDGGSDDGGSDDGGPGGDCIE